MKARPFASAIAAAILLVLALPGTVAALPFGTNLIVNGDAETDAGGDGYSTIVPTGWTTTPGFTVVLWGSPTGFPLFSDPGPVSRGKNFFAGGESTASTNGKQTIDVSAGAAQIDLGSVTFVLDGFLGGFASQGDNAVLTASFLSGADVLLGSAAIGPVTNVDRGFETGLLERSTGGSIPVGTRKIGMTLQLTRLEGSYDDGYADNLSLVLTASDVGRVPIPGTAALLGLGLAGLGLSRRTRTR